MKLTLDNVNVNDIVLGLEVISTIGTSGSPIFGKVYEVIKEEDNLKKELCKRVRYDTIKIVWDNGRVSEVFHMNADGITVVDKTELKNE